jgi:post-segregation antitoxin (ccd killing protein)
MQARKATTVGPSLRPRQAARKQNEMDLAGEVSQGQREIWIEENREAIETYNTLVAKDGVFSRGLRGF